MDNPNHPTYPNPTIQEAICEIHFRLSADEWSPSWYGDFFKAIQDEFPNFIPVTIPHILIGIEHDLSISPEISTPQVVRFQHSSRNLLLQLLENRIVVNVLPEYPGWKQVSEDIKYAWEKICQVTNPALITRTDLRYINRIERSSVDDLLGNWLVPNDYIPPGILRSRLGFLAQISARLDDANRIQITVADQEVQPGYGSFILDISRITEKEMPVDTSLLMDEIIRLHDDVWAVFSSAKGDKLEKLLQGEIL